MTDDAIVAPPAMEFRDGTALAAAAILLLQLQQRQQHQRQKKQQQWQRNRLLSLTCASDREERISPTLPVFRKYLTT